MNKAQLIGEMAAKAELSKVDTKKALDAFVDVIFDTLKKNDRIALIGFGSFLTVDRKARNGRNPQTGQEILIPSKRLVKFKAGSDLLEQIQ